MNRKTLIQTIERHAQEGDTVLELPQKQLASLPPQIGQLHALRWLYLSRNRLSTLPPEIGKLSGLTELDLNSNQFITLPPEIGRLTKLERLELNDNELTTLPPEIFQLDGLRRLYVSRNQLTTLPRDVGRLTSLRWLHLRGNHLTTLPPEIGELRYLEVLDLRENQLTTLPAEIGQLTRLQWLFLQGNKLTALPREIGNLYLIEELDLSDNHIVEVPSEIGRLKVRTLNLSRNRLTKLPQEIGRLSKLSELDLSGNALTTLPPEMGRLESLQWLDMTGSDLISPPPEIVEQGTKAVLAYLRDELLDSKKQWVSKLLVVGEGGAGKTSLLRALLGEPFDTQESTTRGIEIRSLSLNHPERSDVTMQLNTWDFGGQEIYHATHQFFLTNRSLFLLVWNARLGFEQGRLYYWLDTIKARAPQSPVLIVAAFIDERDANIPLVDLYRKYPQIIGHCEISNKTGAGIDGLRVAVSCAAANLPLMGETWPTNWLNAAQAVRSRIENHISPDQLWNLMAEHNVTQEKGEVLAQWLHELGDILYFRDDDELNDTVILDPQWVTQSISRVLESEEVISNLGLFTRDHMNSLWADIDPSMREHFLRLMEKFDLSYRTLENRDISLVVERLSLDPPAYSEVWDAIKASGAGNEISMKFELNTSMPAGIPTWFIARSHRFTTRTHWRYGALFADGPDGKHLGLIQAFPHDRHIRLTARGITPHNFFALLLDGFELTLKRFPGLTIDRKIPCRGHKEGPCSHEFELSHLQSAIEWIPPKLEIECPVAFERVSVPSLLVGLPWSTTKEIIIEQNNKILAQVEYLREGVDELRELAQREFTKLFQSTQARIESYCPNIFILRPQSDGWLRNVLGQSMELQLYCQKPGQWHPTEVGGLYHVNQAAEWLSTMTPYIRRLVAVLKYSAPLIGPWIGTLSTELYERTFKNNIKLMEELVKKLPNLTETSGESFDDPRSSMTLQDSSMERAAGASLRGLRQLLDEKDPRQEWGNLRKILTPEGHYLWLCEHHAREYTE